MPIYQTLSDQEMLHRCFQMGYNCEKNGANETNSHFSLFSTPGRAKAWEAGKKKAKKEKGDKTNE